MRCSAVVAAGAIVVTISAAHSQTSDPAMAFLWCDKICWDKAANATCNINVNTADNLTFWRRRVDSGDIRLGQTVGRVSTLDSVPEGGCPTKARTDPGWEGKAHKEVRIYGVLYRPKICAFSYPQLHADMSIQFCDLTFPQHGVFTVVPD